MTASDVFLVVPTLGLRPALLAEALTSVLEQTHRCRVLVVTDSVGSPAVPIARDLGVPWVQQTTPGLAAAILAGWEADGWRSSYLAWLGDDDRLPKSSVATAVGVLARSADAAMAYGRARFIDDHGRPLHVTRPGRLAGWTLPYGPTLITQPGTLFRTALVRAVGGLDTTLRYTMDLDLFLRLRRVGRLVATGDVLGEFRCHPGSLTQRFTQEMAQEAEMVRRRHRKNTLATRALTIPAARGAVWLSYGITRRLLQ